jgi:hypothetical protein
MTNKTRFRWVFGIWLTVSTAAAQQAPQGQFCVTDDIEVVQAQESLARANDPMISALYAHDLARTELARALGNRARNSEILEGD